MSKLKVEAHRIFYKLVLTNSDTIVADLKDFFKVKGFRDYEIAKLDFVGEPMELAKKEGEDDSFSVHIEFKDKAVVLLFNTDMDSREFYQYIDGWFE